MIVLQQQRRGLRVVLLGGDVEGGQPHLAAGVVLQEHGDNLLMIIFILFILFVRTSFSYEYNFLCEKISYEPKKYFTASYCHLVVPLLQRHGQGGEAVLGAEGLAGARPQQEPHHRVVVLLRRWNNYYYYYYYYYCEDKEHPRSLQSQLQLSLVVTCAAM